MINKSFVFDLGKETLDENENKNLFKLNDSKNSSLNAFLKIFSYKAHLSYTNYIKTKLIMILRYICKPIKYIIPAINNDVLIYMNAKKKL